MTAPDPSQKASFEELIAKQKEFLWPCAATYYERPLALERGEAMHVWDSEGTNGARGQLIMSPRQHEYLAAHQVVYIDLGYRQGIRPGDHFTIYRKVGKSEGTSQYHDYKVSSNTGRDYGSNRYRGGEFSTEGAYQTHEEVLDTRPKLPRKVLGELVVVKVDNSTAVAMITRTVAEVNIGDSIERVQ